MDESASMLWARVVRGINSTEKAVTPAWAMSWTISAEPNGPQESDQNLAFPIERDIRLARNVVRAVTEHLHHDVGRAKDGSAVRNDFCAFVHIRSVRVACLVARAGLDDHFQSSLDEIGDGGGNERNTTFSGKAFFRNSDDHAASSFPCRPVHAARLALLKVPAPGGMLSRPFLPRRDIRHNGDAYGQTGNTNRLDG